MAGFVFLSRKVLSSKIDYIYNNNLKSRHDYQAAERYSKFHNIMVKHEDLNQEDFDAIVTGELTHYALWHEGELNHIIEDYFEIKPSLIFDFRRLILYRDGLTSQDKIEIVRALLPLISNDENLVVLKRLLKEVEEFKSWRNAMAHGVDVSEDFAKEKKIKIEIVSRSGNPKIVEITPESHQTKIVEAEKLLLELQSIRKKIKKS